MSDSDDSKHKTVGAKPETDDNLLKPQVERDYFSHQTDSNTRRQHRHRTDSESKSDLLYKRLSKRLIPSLQGSFGHLLSPEQDSDSDLDSDDKTDRKSNSDLQPDGDGKDEEIDMANPIGVTRPQKSIFNIIASSQIYSDVYKFVQSGHKQIHHRSNSHKSGRAASLAYGVMEDSSDDSDKEDNDRDDAHEDDDAEEQDPLENTIVTEDSEALAEEEEEEKAEEEVDDAYDSDGSDVFEDADDGLDKQTGQAVAENSDINDNKSGSKKNTSSAMNVTNSTESYNTVGSKASSTLTGSTVLNKLGIDEEPVDLSKLTNFQRSIVQNFKITYEGGVLSRFTGNKGVDEEHQLSVKMKLSIGDRLQKVFNLDDDDWFYTNYHTWLIRDVILQGHIYLTKNCILFFAFLPHRYSQDKPPSPSSKAGLQEFDKHDDSNVYIQSGALTMKTKKYGEILGTVLTNRFWAILRPETLSIYSSPTDLYFPNLVIDLRNCTKVEILEKYQPKTEHAYSTHKSPLNPDSPGTASPRDYMSRKNSTEDITAADDDELSKMLASEAEENKENISGGVWFKITTHKKSYKLQADNLYSARQWVNNITKLIFQLHNSNPKNEVLIKIPFDKILHHTRLNLFNASQSMDFDDKLPSAVSFYYQKNTSTKTMQQKLHERTKNVPPSDGEDVHFVFFTGGANFYQKFLDILKEREEQKTSFELSNSERLINKMKWRNHSISGTSNDTKADSNNKSGEPASNEPISTLLPSTYPPNIMKQLYSANTDLFGTFTSVVNDNPHAMALPNPAEFYSSGQSSSSTLKKLSKTLSTKFLKNSENKSNENTRSINSGSSTANSSSTNLGALAMNDSASSTVISPTPGYSSQIVSPSDVSGRSSESTSPVNLHMPRHLSLAGLKNLNMSFDTSKRNIEYAADKYKEYEDKPEDDVDMSLDPQLLPGPLNLADPSEYRFDEKYKKDNKFKSIGKSIKAFSNVSTMWNAQPNHYIQLDDTDPFYLLKESDRIIGDRHFRSHFSLSESNHLSASYYCHVQRSLPVYGKLYVGNELICFRSLLPGVSTRMILPLIDVENCYKELGTKMTYYGLIIVIKGHEELFVEFSSQKARDDCIEMTLEMLHRLHSSETWRPKAHEWGKYYDLELGRKRLEEDDSISESFAPSEETLRQATLRIESARIKLFEDRFTAAAGLQVPIVLEDSPFIKTEIRPNTSYHFVLLTIGSRGDVQPYIALGKGLIKEGHKVTIATHIEFQDWIKSHNIGFREIAGDPTELMSLMVTHGSMSVAFIKEASAKFKGWINDLLKTSWEACQGADILIESPSAMGGVHIAEALGIPYMRAFTMPWTRTRAYSHAFIMPDQKKGGSYNYLTHVMFETVFWKGIASQVNRWRVELLNLPRTNLFKLQQNKIPFLYNVSQTVLAPAVDFPDWVKVTGYWFLDEGAAEKYKPSEELVQFIKQASIDQKKIVYIGFGSIVVNDAKSLTKAVIEAVLDADVRCILNKGWSDRLSELKEGSEAQDDIELPREIYNSGAIPHDWLFPRIDAAVHHGGSGTTGATLRSGLPTIIKPFFGDQFFYASRVEEIGAGIALRKLNAKSLCKALRSATTDIKLIDKAKKISEQIRNEHGVLNAIEAIYSELEYARSLIINKQIANEQARLNAYKSGTSSYALNTPQNEEAIDEDDEDVEDNDDDSLIEIDYSSKSDIGNCGETLDSVDFDMKPKVL